MLMEHRWNTGGKVVGFFPILFIWLKGENPCHQLVCLTDLFAFFGSEFSLNVFLCKIFCFERIWSTNLVNLMLFIYPCMFFLVNNVCSRLIWVNVIITRNWADIRNETFRCQKLSSFSQRNLLLSETEQFFTTKHFVARNWAVICNKLCVANNWATFGNQTFCE